MQNFTSFFMENYTPILGFALVVYFIYRKFSLDFNKSVTNCSAEEAYQIMKTDKDVIVLDVRTKEEYQDGHIPGSKSVPLGELGSRISELLKYKDKPILVHCASGGRSPSAVRILLKHNFSKIYHLKRGLRGWTYGLK